MTRCYVCRAAHTGYGEPCQCGEEFDYTWDCQRCGAVNRDAADACESCGTSKANSMNIELYTIVSGGGNIDTLIKRATSWGRMRRIPEQVLEEGILTGLARTWEWISSYDASRGSFISWGTSILINAIKNCVEQDVALTTGRSSLDEDTGTDGHSEWHEVIEGSRLDAYTYIEREERMHILSIMARLAETALGVCANGSVYRIMLGVTEERGKLDVGVVSTITGIPESTLYKRMQEVRRAWQEGTGVAA